MKQLFKQIFRMLLVMTLPYQYFETIESRTKLLNYIERGINEKN